MPTSSATNAAAARYLPSTSSQIVIGLVKSSSWVPCAFSVAKRPIVTPGIRNSITTQITL